VSILKPVKGAEEHLEENLDSFFALEYPCFELLFTVADENDPAIPVIEKLIGRHPKVSSRLFVGEVVVGSNPKVNNLVKSYRQARYDAILISDSNVRVGHEYLRAVVASFGENVGIVTAVVCGDHVASLGAALEASFLNTFYARFMVIADRVGTPVVIGKSMLFRKSEAERFGGIRALARYLAEDYMAGQAMRLLGRKIELMDQPVVQPLGRYDFWSFWSRHIRWGRLRKSQAPLAFVFEPLMSFWISGLIGAWAMSAVLGVGFWMVFAIHTLFWCSLDLAMMKIVSGRIRWWAPFSWIVRESLHFPLWLNIASGRTVIWRGRKLTLTHGGLLE
jgi:ceramide glucosyltransferase